MDIDTTKCVGCGNCHIICTMGAISLDADGRSVVNQDECVECSTCYRVLKNEGYWVWFVRAIRKVLSFFHLGHLSDTDLCPTERFPTRNGCKKRVMRSRRTARPISAWAGRSSGRTSHDQHAAPPGYDREL
ncbi:MAG: 4Fe-4S binding protein [Pseudomonadota bacterium]